MIVHLITWAVLLFIVGMIIGYAVGCAERRSIDRNYGDSPP